MRTRTEPACVWPPTTISTLCTGLPRGPSACAGSQTARCPSEKDASTPHWWIVDGETYLGAIDLRHYLNAFLLEGGGHIGYSIRPSARQRGPATWALGAVLLKAPALGLDRILLTCDDDNAASARTIERNGGILQDVRHTQIGVKRRYWIALDNTGRDNPPRAVTRTGAS
ncbi:GNAT family N-acetyltransferase [Streptomyces sp. NPDC001286]